MCFPDFNNAQEIGWLRDAASEGEPSRVDRPGGRRRVKGRKEKDPPGWEQDNLIGSKGPN